MRHKIVTPNEKNEPPVDVQKVVSAMRDSVWFIEHELEKQEYEGKEDNIKRNVQHLQLMMSNSAISESKLSLNDVESAIEAGENYLSSRIS